MDHVSWIEYIAAALFFLALIHTFSAKYFVKLAQRESRHAGAWLMLGEVEVVFGFWAFILLGFMATVCFRHSGHRRDASHPSGGTIADRLACESHSIAGDDHLLLPDVDGCAVAGIVHYGTGCHDTGCHHFAGPVFFQKNTGNHEISDDRGFVR